MNLKELFDKAENGTFTYDQFVEAAKAAGAKFEDISEGKYVSKFKYEQEIGAKDKEIETLNTTISTRDTDLADLKSKLEAAGTDAEKLAELQTNLSTLQTNYDNDVKAYKKQLSQQAYEFAVKEFAADKKFTSNAAKRDFIQSMIAKELKMDKGKILGAEDFVTSYSADNADAFVVENPDPEPTPPAQPKPTFVAPTQGSGQQQQDPTGGFANAFHFTTIHPMNNT